MKKLTLIVAVMMIAGSSFAQEKACCKKKGEKCSKGAQACCKKKGSDKEAPKKEDNKQTK